MIQPLSQSHFSPQQRTAPRHLGSARLRSGLRRRARPRGNASRRGGRSRDPLHVGWVDAEQRRGWQGAPLPRAGSRPPLRVRRGRLTTHRAAYLPHRPRLREALRRRTLRKWRLPAASRLRTARRQRPPAGWGIAAARRPLSDGGTQRRRAGSASSLGGCRVSRLLLVGCAGETHESRATGEPQPHSASRRTGVSTSRYVEAGGGARGPPKSGGRERLSAWSPWCFLQGLRKGRGAALGGTLQVRVASSTAC